MTQEMVHIEKLHFNICIIVYSFAVQVKQNV